MLSLTLAAMLTAGAPARATESDPSAEAALHTGDRAWFEADRRVARKSWSAATETADPALRARAEWRMALVSGNVGLIVHGLRGDKALAACTDEGRCLLAAAERELLLRAAGYPSDLDRVDVWTEIAGRHFPDDAQSIRVWAGLESVDVLEASEAATPDNLGALLAANGGTFPRGPGTWALGLGVAGASGAGVGGGLVLSHPDVGLRGHRSELSLTATSRGAGQISASITTRGTSWWTGSLRAQRLVQDRYVNGEPVDTELAGVVLAAVAPGLGDGAWAGWAGPLARFDAVDHDLIAGHGAWGGLRWRPHRRVGVVASLEASLIGSVHLEPTLDLRWTPATDRGPAARLVGQQVVASTAPAHRSPTAGGGQLLRSAPIGRFRDDTVAVAVAEWRQPLVARLQAVPFAEAAWVDGLHGGAGLGLRWLAPQGQPGTVRLDLGIGDGGLGLSAGWGQAF